MPEGFILIKAEGGGIFATLEGAGLEVFLEVSADFFIERAEVEAGFEEIEATAISSIPNVIILFMMGKDRW